MDTNRLRQFCTIVETGSFRQASQLLRISHSGLSKSMKALEAELGYRLFLQSGRGVAVTDEGRALFERSTSFFVELGRLLGTADVRPSETLRLGSFEVFTSHFIGKLAGTYLRDIDIEVHELIPGRLEEALISQRIDVGITYDPIPRKGIDYVKMGSVTMAACALRGAFRGKNTVDVPFVVPVRPLEGAPSGVKGLGAWPENKFRRSTPFSVDLLGTGLELVRQGLCAIFIPRFVIRLHNESIAPEFRFEALELPRGMKPVKRDVFIVTRESTEENRHTQQIARALREICFAE